ncbi:MAG: hydrolase [Candidatus Saccharimonadales bacterium]
MSKSTTGCCPPFEPDKWDGETFKFNNKLFMRFTTRSFLHVPLNMNSAMTTALAKIAEAEAGGDEYLMLSNEISPWKAEHYIAVDTEVPDSQMALFSGTYMAKVFEGPFKEMRGWYRQLIDYVKSTGAQPVRTFFGYTTCPNCAKAYGKNYVIGFEQIQAN